MKIKSLSGSCFAGPVSSVCLLSLLAVAVACPLNSGARVSAAENVEPTSGEAGAWDAQNSEGGINALADEDIMPLALTSSLTIGSPTVSASAQPGGTAYAKSNITYNVSDTSGWQLRASYANGKTALTGSTTMSGAAGKTGSSMTDNTWGYAWSDSTSATEANLAYQTMPNYGSTTAMKTGITNANTTGAIYFAAKFANNATPGHYTTDVLVSLVATPPLVTRTLSYNANGTGATGAPSSQSCQTSDTSCSITISATKPTRTGYDFQGWSTSSTATTANSTYDPGKTVSISANTTLYAVWKAQVTGIKSLTNMQDMTSAACTASAVGDTATLKDTRDNNTYTVAKLTDGKCWMTQNLRIVNKTITSADSNVSSNYAIPASALWSAPSSTANYKTQPGAYYNNDTTYGAYYSYYTATAGTTGSMTSGTASYDICPKGWRLPTGGSSGEFQALYNKYTTATWTTNNSKNGRWFGAANAAAGGAFFPAAGVVRGSLGNAGSYGYYWSSTIGDSNYSYSLNFGSSNVSPAGSDNRYRGFSVRCVAK